MNLPLNIILDCLREYRCDVHIPLPSDRKFDRVTLPPQNGGELSPDRLYLCRLSAAMQLVRTAPEECCFLCLRDRIEDGSETEETLRGMVIVNENITFEQLFGRVQDTFCRINNWYSAVQESVIKNRPLQEIVDQSEEILQNYVQITDSAFKLLAYTRHTECDEPITILARQYGYHPESTVKQFRKFHRMEAWDRTTGILVNDSHDMSKYTLVSKIFKFRNTYFAHAVMTCNNHPATPGMVELFEIFMDVIGIFVEKDWEAMNSCNHIYDSFLTDLLEGNIPRREMVEERARHVSIPFQGRFTLCLTAPDESGRFSVGRMAQELADILPNDRIILFHGQIALLTGYTGTRYLEQRDAMREAMLPLMEKYDTRCGVSAFFECLTDTAGALTQAQLALKYSGQTPGASLLPETDGVPAGLECRFSTFEDSFLYILFGGASQNRELWRGSVYCQAMRTLQKYDGQHGQNNLQLLYVYLINERRPTETASTLHMSRNNVVYRIGRIEEMLNMDLNSPNLRLKLLASYTMLQLYGLD